MFSDQERGWRHQHWDRGNYGLLPAVTLTVRTRTYALFTINITTFITTFIVISNCS
jgi:hypothetical protein